jgi:hypothetical protein
MRLGARVDRPHLAGWEKRFLGAEALLRVAAGSVSSVKSITLLEFGIIADMIGRRKSRPSPG